MFSQRSANVHLDVVYLHPGSTSTELSVDDVCWTLDKRSSNVIPERSSNVMPERSGDDVCWTLDKRSPNVVPKRSVNVNPRCKHTSIWRWRATFRQRSDERSLNVDWTSHASWVVDEIWSNLEMIKYSFWFCEICNKNWNNSMLLTYLSMKLGKVNQFQFNVLCYEICLWKDANGIITLRRQFQTARHIFLIETDFHWGERIFEGIISEIAFLLSCGGIRSLGERNYNPPCYHLGWVKFNPPFISIGLGLA